MNRYFTKLFADFNENEQNLLGDMIFRIGNGNMSYAYWRATMSEEEKKFVRSLVKRVDEEYFNLLDEEITEHMTTSVYHLFAEIMIYYITYHEEIGWAMPSIGMLYGESAYEELRI